MNERDSQLILIILYFFYSVIAPAQEIGFTI